MEIRKYKAYWVVEDKEVRVFPGSKKHSMFGSVEEASKRLEGIGRYNPLNTRGIIKDWHNNVILTIAL